MGVEACIGDPKDPSRIPSAQKEQHRAEGKEDKEISRPHVSVDETNGDEMPSDDEESMCHQDHQKALNLYTKDQNLVAFMTCLISKARRVLIMQ